MVLKPADLGTLVGSARVIVHGRVVSLRAQSSDRTRIQTLVTLNATDYFKGDLGPEVTFVVPGGTLGRYRTVVSGAPQLAEGDEVVLFLGTRGPALPYLIRLGEGVFRVQRDARTGQRIVSRHPVIAESSAWQRVARGTPAAPLSVSDFGAMVRRLAGAPR
jgi:hypothetical protein